MVKIAGNKWATLAIVLIGFFMILIDISIVNVSIPTLINDLHANLADVEWVVSGFALAYAALLITFGRLGDLFGRKLLFLLGLTVFTIASFFSGEASTISTLIIARIFQGVGGAMLSPAVLSIISSTFQGRERANAFGAFGAVSGLAVAVGPILGGWLTTDFSWRWIFRVNIPIGVLALVLAALVIRESKAEQGKAIDWSGMATSSLGFFALVFALIEGQTYGWWKPTQDFIAGQFVWRSTGSLSIVAISFILAALFLGAFAVIQQNKTRHQQSPAVDFRFFQHRTFRYGLVAVGVLALGEFSSLFTLPIFLQSIHGFTPLQSGFAVLPIALMILIGAPLAAAAVNQIGSKWVITGGMLLETVGLFWLGRLHADTSYRILVPSLLVFGFGIGFAIAQTTQIILAEIDQREAGSASGVLNTVRQVGTALGIAVVGAVLAHQSATRIPNAIRAASIPNVTAAQQAQIADQSISIASTEVGSTTAVQQFAPAPPPAVAANPQLLAAFQAKTVQTEQAIQTAVNQGLADSIGFAVMVGALFVLGGMLLSLFIPNIKVEHETEPTGH